MMADAEDVILSVSGLGYTYGGSSQQRYVLRDLNLTVRVGEIVCIIGASGCGKSTLLNLIAGLQEPTTGSIAGGAANIANPLQKRRIGYIFQQDALLPWRSVEANLLLAADLNPGIGRVAAGTKLSQYLQTFNLENFVLDKYPSELSGGMRQRISIIQSLMFDPQLFLLDEPFSALDFFTKLKLEGEFYQLIKEQKKAALIVTHDIEEAVAMADRILLMSLDGSFSKEFVIDFLKGEKSSQADRSPENIRGTSQFAEYYQAIWSELKAAVT